MSCVHSGLNIFLVTYADDIFNISQTLDKNFWNFSNLQAEYLKSGLEFNAIKSDVVLFTGKTLFLHESVLGNSKISPSDQIVYLGIPIGNTISHVRYILSEVIKRRISA